MVKSCCMHGRGVEGRQEGTVAPRSQLGHEKWAAWGSRPLGKFSALINVALGSSVGNGQIIRYNIVDNHKRQS